MNKRNEFFERVRRERVLAIVRSDGDLAPTVRALWEGGITLVEIALSSANALQTIKRLAGVGAIGAGTVRTRADAERALDAGASFLVSPNMDPLLVRWAAENDVPHLPGVFTATEIEAARRLGAGPLKLFPASAGGPGYVSALLAPFPDVELVPTGGVTLEDAVAYLASGAVAVALGGALVSSDPEKTRAAAARITAAFDPSLTSLES
jgi:2-dehydro-3-deoxyphosphogluconate aldolase / (4S)-4-hydroxy-2-oxoglutarate aldolase